MKMSNGVAAELSIGDNSGDVHDLCVPVSTQRLSVCPFQQPNADPSQIEFNLLDPSRVWALPGLAANTKPSFTHPHPYNSPTRDPSTFPYNPKPTANSTNPAKSQRDSVPKSADTGKPRDQAISSKPSADSSHRQREPSGKSLDSNNSSSKHQRQLSEKTAAKKTNTLPQTYHYAPDETTDGAKPVSVRSNNNNNNSNKQQQSKSPSTSHKQAPVPLPRTSAPNSVRTSGSGHTTPITTPRSSQLSVTRKSNRQSSMKPPNSNRANKSGKPDSCCSVM